MAGAPEHSKPHLGLVQLLVQVQCHRPLLRSEGSSRTRSGGVAGGLRFECVYRVLQDISWAWALGCVNVFTYRVLARNTTRPYKTSCAGIEQLSSCYP